MISLLVEVFLKSVFGTLLEVSLLNLLYLIFWGSILTGLGNEDVANFDILFSKF